MTHPSNIVKNPSWWRKRTRLERALMIAVATAAVFLVIFATILTCLLHQEEKEMLEPLPTMSALNKSEDKTFFNRKNEPELCLEEGCIHAASQILSQMDKNAEPCDDFYQFACGQFRKKFIPDDKTSITSFSVISDKLDEQLREILSEPVTSEEIVPIQNAKQVYNLCMNESKIEDYGVEPVLSLFKRLGGWPVLEEESWDANGSWQWRETLYTFRKNGFGADYFVDFSVIPDLKNSTNRILNYDQALLGLSREYLVKGMEHKRVKAYYDYMVDIAVLFQADRKLAEKQLLESLQLEMKLAEISLPREERRDSNKLYNVMTIGEMMLKFPSIPWREYTNKLLPDVLEVGDDEPVIVSVPKYITELEKILEQTPKRVLANYLMWRVAVSTVSYLPQRFRDRQLKYSTLVSGTKTRQPRWMECSDLATRSISLAVGSLYVQRNFDQNAKAKALDLVNRVREEVYKTLETVDWMDEKTRKAAIEKAHSITTHIGYPDELLDQNKIVDFYRGLDIDGNGPYLDVILNMTKFGTNYTLSRLREKINKTDWISHSRAPVVNAYYSPLENSIQFPAGILQGVFFSDKRPNYMNFGTIGYVIGHEITHGFDDQGKQFDKDGDLNDWWEKETEDKYKQKARCIIEQYGNFTAKQVNLKLSGVNTQGENIADNGGVKFAYKAYESWVKDQGEEPRLPGLHQYTPNQMFWISVASSWCNAYRDESLSNLITTGYHSPGEFRVNGPLSNTPVFARDFNCPSGSPMNPSKKMSSVVTPKEQIYLYFS